MGAMPVTLYNPGLVMTSCCFFACPSCWKNIISVSGSFICMYMYALIISYDCRKMAM